jgi:hypothetical protein
MGMNLNQFQRFMGRVDKTLNDLFPAVIRIAGKSYACTGVGGSAALEFLSDGGQAPAGTRFFRLEKSILSTRPETGTQIKWLQSPSSEVDFTLIDCPDRPHETAWVLQCAPKNR